MTKVQKKIRTTKRLGDYLHIYEDSSPIHRSNQQVQDLPVDYFVSAVTTQQPSLSSYWQVLQI